MCPELPLWFIALATFGAISFVSLLILAVIVWFSWIFAEKEEVTHVAQIPRRRYRRTA